MGDRQELLQVSPISLLEGNLGLLEAKGLLWFVQELQLEALLARWQRGG